MNVSTSTRKIQIEQSVPSGSVGKGPYDIERSVDPNEVVIRRKLGEGSKPLFQRDDIVVNPKNVSDSAEDHTKKQLGSRSPERIQKYKNRNNECATSGNTSASRHTKVDKPAFDSLGPTRKRTARRDSPPTYSHRRRTPEKLPYFIDEVRERDRLRRKYGTKPEKPLSSLPSSRSRRSRSRPTSRSRSRSLDSAQFKNRSKSLRTQHRSISRDRYLGESSRRDRTHSDKTKDKTHSRYRHRSEDRGKSDRRRRSSRSPSKSRSRSRDPSTRSRRQSSHNERRRHRYNDQDGPSITMNQRSLLHPQIIPIPIPVPADFMNYSYSTWPTNNHWAPPMMAPRHGPHGTYHMQTILPGAMMPLLRPPLPPLGLFPPPPRYGGPGFRLPMQYGPSGHWRPNFRPKNT
ncbi:PREDICTED: serine/threonine-protein kinase fray2-like isoform X2 [Rhagoletis zephyria]|uniref:serine/threonine-protein kinase fray2-like isoform X2 n=1 Tax=Rhagoletis zephyria TaxID=28612 RepID=UPI0008118C23|nr:PREDICTED: serine/threonine-protein kinase fray2-like isoform X2 [Rhagoletis zephyria]